jgi:hypothetical protein
MGECFSKAVCRTHNIEKGLHMTEIYPLNEKIFDQDEFLSFVIDRPCSWVKEPASGPPSTKDSKEEGISAGFVGGIEASPEIISPSLNLDPKKCWKKHGKSRILTDMLIRGE